MLQALLAALRTLPASLPDGVPDLAAARARLEAGVPALDGEPLLDGASFLANARTIAAHLRADLTAGAMASAMAEALAHARHFPDIDLCVEAATRGAWDVVASMARAQGLDEDAFVTVADYAVRPVLRVAADRVRGLLAGRAWPHGHCPACGTLPLLAELRGREHDRVLRCGRCASAWDFPRLRCAACGERDHRKLGYLHAEGEGEFKRADRCDSCRSYLKAIAVLDPLGADALLAEDLASAGLDLVAFEHGYHR